MNSTAATLRQVLDLLDEGRNWARLSLHTRGSYCLMGGLNKVRFGTTYPTPELLQEYTGEYPIGNPWYFRTVECDAIFRAIREVRGVGEQEIGTCNAIIDFNDDAAWSDVEQVLKRAIEIAEEEDL